MYLNSLKTINYFGITKYLKSILNTFFKMLPKTDFNVRYNIFDQK